MKTTPTIFMMVTLGIISFTSFFVLYFIEGYPNMLFHIIAISNLGLWALFVIILPKIAEVKSEHPKVPPWLTDLIIKSWNEGLTPEERERLRLWYEDEEIKEDPGEDPK